MSENRLIKWHNDGYPPIDLNKEVSSVAHLIQDTILLEQRNKLLTEALENILEEIPRPSLPITKIISEIAKDALNKTK